MVLDTTLFPPGKMYTVHLYYGPWFEYLFFDVGKQLVGDAPRGECAPVFSLIQSFSDWSSITKNMNSKDDSSGKRKKE